jgi:hypothetical protein
MAMIDEEDQLADEFPELSPRERLRVMCDGCLYSGTADELVVLLHAEAHFSGAATPEIWMREAAQRAGVRSDTPKHFIADLIWKAGMLEPVKREYEMAADGKTPRISWP